MTDTRHRIVSCPRDGQPHGVLIETFGPDAHAADMAGIFYSPRETWPKGWTPFSWHESLEAAKGAVFEHIARERVDIEKHRARLAAWADIEICA